MFCSLLFLFFLEYEMNNGMSNGKYKIPSLLGSITSVDNIFLVQIMNIFTTYTIRLARDDDHDYPLI